MEIKILERECTRSKFPQLQVGPKSSPFQARVVSVTNQYILSPEDKILLSNAYIL